MVYFLFLSAALSPRLRATDGGLAQRRLTLHFLRTTSVHVRTARSAGLLPPLRQTARCIAAELGVCHYSQILILLANSAENLSNLFNSHGFATVRHTDLSTLQNYVKFVNFQNVFSKKFLLLFQAALLCQNAFDFTAFSGCNNLSKRSPAILSGCSDLSIRAYFQYFVGLYSFVKMVVNSFSFAFRDVGCSRVS